MEKKPQKEKGIVGHPAPKVKYASFPEPKTVTIEKPPVVMYPLPEHWKKDEEPKEDKK